MARAEYRHQRASRFIAWVDVPLHGLHHFHVTTSNLLGAQDDASR